MSKIIDFKSGAPIEGAPGQPWYSGTSVHYFQAAMLAVTLGGVTAFAYALYVLNVGPHQAACYGVGFGVVLAISLFSAAFGFVMLRIGIPGSLRSFHRPHPISHREGILVIVGLVAAFLVASVVVGSVFQQGMALTEQAAELQRNIKINEFVDRMRLPAGEGMEMVAKVKALNDETLQMMGILPLTCK